METITYEEDLQTNPLYIRLIDKYSLLNEISVNNWIVALPKRSSFSSKCLNNHEFMLSHILTPSEELPKTHFCNLIGDEVLINGTEVKFKNDSSKSPPIRILFEEYFYTKDSQRYKIICLDKPLSTKFANSSNSTATTCNSDSVVKNVQQSLELIRHRCSKQVERKIDNAVKNFNLRIQKSTDYESLKKNINLLYDYCVNIVCNRKIKEEPFLCMNMKFSIEYILMDSIYDKIFDAIIIQYAEENEKFNKIQRKLSSITLNDLNISSSITATILEHFNVIRTEMLKIDTSKTSLDKLSCIKNVIDTISSLLIGNMTTDLLLPTMVYIIIKSNYYHWIPTLTFIKEFNLSSVLSSEHQSSGSALQYILTTLEAIIYFIQTNEDMQLQNHQLFEPKDDVRCFEDYLLHIFQSIKSNDENQFQKLLAMPYSVFKNDNSLQNNSALCHPLCACTKCMAKAADKESNPCNVNQASHQDKLTMLHVASAYNVPKLVSNLINQGADVNAQDICGFTPLHYASQRGHQKVLFLLLHNQNNSINLRTNNQQTPLILSSMYGHEQCVKALLFFAEHTHTAIDVNAQDVDGMTALHYATQSGFNGIVENLLEYQAKATIKNHIGKMAVDYTRNSVMVQKLEEAVKYQVEELPITENEFIFIRKDDLADIFQDDT